MKTDWSFLTNKGSETANDFARRWDRKKKEEAGRIIPSRKPWPPKERKHG